MIQFSNSPLVAHTRLSPHRNAPRNQPIRKITIHMVAGVTSIESLGTLFSGTRQVSSNYGVGSDGRIGMYVEERNRAWTSSSAANDHQAITIEVSNSALGGNWPVSDHVLEATINLCVDICRRNNIPRLVYDGTPNGSLTRHNMFAATSCPGLFLQSKFPYIAQEVTRRLSPQTAAQQPENRAPSLRQHTVVARDTLWALAQRYLGNGNRWREIQRLNGGINALRLPIGMRLNIPDRGTTNE